MITETENTDWLAEIDGKTVADAVAYLQTLDQTRTHLGEFHLAVLAPERNPLRHRPAPGGAVLDHRMALAQVVAGAFKRHGR